MSDPVNHPEHYTRFDNLEVIDLTEQMNFNLGNAVKYVCRSGYKHDTDPVEDLEKAVWYIKREISRIKRLRSTQTTTVAMPQEIPRVLGGEIKKSFLENFEKRKSTVSADNGWVLRRDNQGKYVLQQYWASADSYPPIDDFFARKFDSPSEAVEWYEREAGSSEYGLKVLTSYVTYPNEETESEGTLSSVFEERMEVLSRQADATFSAWGGRSEGDSGDGQGRQEARA